MCIGLRYSGCRYLNVRDRKLGSLEGTTRDLRDNESERIRPVSKYGMQSREEVTTTLE